MTANGRPRQSTREKSPAYQWYPKDALSDRTMLAMTNEVEGVYRRLLDHAWLENGLPSNLDEIVPLCKVKSRAGFDRIWRTLSHLFPQGPDGRRRNRRQERERRKQRKNSRVRQLAARARWDKPASSSNAHAMHMQCFPIALALACTDHDQDQDQGAPRPRPLRMVPTTDRRRHLLAAVHRIIDTGPPYVDPVGGLNIAEISEELKTVARKLEVDWSHTRELDTVINAAIAQRAAGGRGRR